MRFFCITEGWLSDTNDIMRASCLERGIEYIQLEPVLFDYQKSPRPQPGDLMYRPGAHIACRRLEHFLYTPRIATLNPDPFFDCFNQMELLAKVGVPVLKTVSTIKPKMNREVLISHVEYLGGFPVILKIPGSEGGVGIIKVDTFEGLFSLIDYLQYAPLMMEYFEHIVAYRLVVLGDRIIDNEARRSGAHDFRTNALGADTLGKVDVPDKVREAALNAAKYTRNEFGGVDIIQAENGDIRFCEINFPCYFAGQQKNNNADISGMMIDYLIEKAGKLNPSRLTG